MIESNVGVKLQSFKVPDSVLESASVMPQPTPSVLPESFPPVEPVWGKPYIIPRMFQLSEIPCEDLKQMCEDFTKEVFKRAGLNVYIRLDAEEIRDPSEPIEPGMPQSDIGGEH